MLCKSARKIAHRRTTHAGRVARKHKYWCVVTVGCERLEQKGICIYMYIYIYIHIYIYINIYIRYVHRDVHHVVPSLQKTAATAPEPKGFAEGFAEGLAAGSFAEGFTPRHHTTILNDRSSHPSRIYLYI